jgi:hypothetical protein
MGWGSMAFDTTDSVAGVMIEAIGISLDNVSHVPGESAGLFITM